MIATARLLSPDRRRLARGKELHLLRSAVSLSSTHSFQSGQIFHIAYNQQLIQIAGLASSAA
jgi:hypothetical protein